MIRKRVPHFLLVLLASFVLAGQVFAKDTDIPNLVGDIYVQDFADILTENEENQLKSIGRSLENQTTAQVSVLTVETTEGTPIAEYANEAFRQYGIGSEVEDNGVLLVLAIDDHKVQIEVGYGLEGRLPDGKIGRILDEHAIPYLKDNEPNKAVIETYEVLAQEVATEYGVAGGQQTTEKQATEEEGIGIPTWLIILLIVAAVFIDFKFFGGTLTSVILSILSRGGGRGGGDGGSRGGGGGSSGGGGAGRGW
ncbi:TPM domain-containing protein [Bacillus sp. JJ634]